ncbi:MAG: hypothetical protein U0670_04170 [Anaerolineae bacterium]
MAGIYTLQASGAMFDTISPEGWTFKFAVFVTDENGAPVTGLKKIHFHIWDITHVSDLSVNVFSEIGKDIPSSKLKGIYALQTQAILSLQAPAPQQFLFALRASKSTRILSGFDDKKRVAQTFEGETTVAITYLGKAH